MKTITLGTRSASRPVLRKFTCQCCGKEVKIYNPRDKRELFCSYTCKSLFYLFHPQFKINHI